MKVMAVNSNDGVELSPWWSDMESKALMEAVKVGGSTLSPC